MSWELNKGFSPIIAACNSFELHWFTMVRWEQLKPRKLNNKMHGQKHPQHIRTRKPASPAVAWKQKNPWSYGPCHPERKKSPLQERPREIVKMSSSIAPSLGFHNQTRERKETWAYNYWIITAFKRKICCLLFPSLKQLLLHIFYPVIFKCLPTPEVTSCEVSIWDH